MTHASLFSGIGGPEVAAGNTVKFIWLGVLRFGSKVVIVINKIDSP